MTEEKPKPFPEASTKISAPTRKSQFERQKAEAEAKRARERAETAAVYEDFVKSFEDDTNNKRERERERDAARSAAEGGRLGSSGGGSRGLGGLGGGGPPKRHFTNTSTLGQRLSGPGTLGPAPPPPSFSRKRTHDGFAPLHRNRSPGALGFESPGSGGGGGGGGLDAFRASDDEDEKAADAKEAERVAAKPTLYLATLPPGTSPAAIKALIPSTVSVDNVKILPASASASAQGSTERKSMAAIVTLANDTAASDIDSTVSALQNRYLGWGYYLSISRHLSSAALGSTMPVTVGMSSINSHPFGAKPMQPRFGSRLSRAPPPGSQRGRFAPPSSYGPGYGRGGPALQVEVQAPSDLKQLKLIHKTLENLLNYGPEFEALLMSRPEVQRDEKWAWLWDARSIGGVYYRWKLWDIVTNSQSRTGRPRRGRNQEPSFIFEGGMGWLAPRTSIKFEYTTRMDEFVSDEDYNSSDEEQSDAEDDRRLHGGGPPKDMLGSNSDGTGYMNPFQKAKLTHLLARLPTSHGRLRKGDIARVTAFAIEHAGAGADEVVEMIIANIMNPLVYTGANPENGSAKRENCEEVNSYDNTQAQGPRLSTMKTNQDLSAAKLVGLYVVSDILSSSATSGVRHAWRYRQLFESALKSHRVFEHLGRLEKDLQWGRLKAEKWKRSIGSLLQLWEGWCVFPQSSHEHFVHVFEKPPLTEQELREEKEKAEAERAASAVAKSKSRWKAVEEDAAARKFDPSRPPQMGTQEKSATGTTGGEDDYDGEPMSDIDGVPMEDSDLEAPDGEPMEEDDDDGAPIMEDVDMERKESEAQPDTGKQASEKSPERSLEQPAKQLANSEERPPPARKPRPKAEDMFADSDSE